MIQVEKLSYRLGHRQLFSDLSFHLPAGRICAILGPNGRGKTTLLRLLLGIQKGATGDIRLNAPVAYVPQLDGSFFSYSVRTMVTLGRVRHLPWYASPSVHDHRIVMRCLEYLGLSRFADHPFNRLSGGEKQMVMIARALAAEPKILMLDEPTSALDLTNQDCVLSALRELAADHHMTLLFSSHYPQHALHIADRALLLFADGGYQFGRCGEVLTEAGLAQLYQIPVALTSVTRGNRHTRGVTPLFG